MIKRNVQVGLIAAVTAVMLVVGAGSAGAAVSFSFEPTTHAPSSVDRGDTYFTYTITIRNTGDTPTSAPTNVHLSLSEGTLFDGLVNGAGWSCFPTARTCTYSGAPVGAGEPFPTLTVGVLIDPVRVPDTVQATFTAFGGGAASNAIGQHVFTLGPALSFGLAPGTFHASACFDAPSPVAGTVTTTTSSSQLTEAASATGTGSLTAGSITVTGLTVSTGAFLEGQVILGTGIPGGTTIEEVDTAAGTLDLSTPATADGAQALVAHGFTVGQVISGAGIPSGATITGVSGRTLTISTQATADASAVSVSAVTPIEFPSVACQAAQAGDTYTQAGGHPFSGTTTFEFVRGKGKPVGSTGPLESPRDVVVSLPPGFVANPTVIQGGCTIAQVSTSTCPERFAIGRAEIELNGLGEGRSPVYKVQSELGYPAAFAVRPVTLSRATVVLRPKVRPGDFTVAAFAPRPPQAPQLMGVKHFTFCAYGARVEMVVFDPESTECKQPDDDDALPAPFFTNPTRCTGEEDVTSIDVSSYQHPARFEGEGFPDLSDPNWKSYKATSPPLRGCNRLPFEPSFEGRPTTNVADSPSGLDFDLHFPQNGLLGKDEAGNRDPDAIATAHLKKTTVVLPEGLVVNPSSATGLETCTSDQMGLTTLNHPEPYPIRFNGQPAQCPNGAKLGTVEVTSPLVDETLRGGFYLAEQDDPRTTTPGAENPFDSTLAAYLAIRNDQIGVSAKLAGKIELDKQTGRITTTFDNNPQLPFDTLRLRIPGGARGSLRTPSTCGTRTTQATFTPWSEQTPPAELGDSFDTSAAPRGGLCPTEASQLPVASKLDAGTVNARAGAYSPFVLRLRREDGEQEINGIETVLPPGLTGRLAGVPYCPETGIARAQARSNPREGQSELNDPSCPADSFLGDVEVAAGAGPTPYRTSGKAYLAGPYKGAPVSMVVITPAVAGPFDLGTVVVRNALYVNPVTAQVSVKSDPIPTILEGIPLAVREINVSITRNQFTLNPTNCEPMSVGATAFGLISASSLSSRFQVGECAALKFKPRFKLQLHGKTRRAAYQRLVATVNYPKGAYANISRAAVTLPHSAFLAQEHIRTVCTRVQFAANNCPKAAIYGRAQAKTPLLDYALKGPVYLRSSSNPLPDLVADLRGPDHQPIKVELSGRTDSKNQGIRNTFDVVPDAPVSRFRLEMFGGSKSLIVNSRNLCKGPKQRATVRLRAHNGRRYDFRPVVGNDCKKGKSKKAGKGKKRGGKGNYQGRAQLAVAQLLTAW